MDVLLTTPPEVLKLASHPVRWGVLTRLARSDYRVQELVAYLGLPQNLVSYHLRLLRAGNLVIERKSSADERFVYYSLDLERFRALYLQAGEQVHPVLAEPLEPVLLDDRPYPVLRVLFLCTGNSARSQMAEALLRTVSHGKVEVYSAGSEPAECVHPLAVQAMHRAGLDLTQAVPRHMSLFFGQHFDAVVSVCDRVREACPTFPGDPERIHWSFPDPALVEGSQEEQYLAFEQTGLQLMTRVRLLLILLESKQRERSLKGTL